MKKSGTIILCSCVFFVASNVFAQSNTVVSGGQATGVTGNVSYTIGQVNYIVASGSGGTIAEGLQQPIEIFPTSVNEPHDTFSALLFPNPASDFIVLQVESSKINKMKYQLFDLQGNLIAQYNLNSDQTNISTRQLVPQAYLLKISNQQEFKTFKIIKHQ